jgi:hypothetical protein
MAVDAKCHGYESVSWFMNIKEITIGTQNHGLESYNGIRD